MKGNLVGRLMDYEAGELDQDQILDLFADLVRSGTVWALQGSYQRTAHELINAGLLSPTGELTGGEVIA